MKLIVFHNPPTPDWTILLVVIYYNNRTWTIFSWYIDVALPVQLCKRLVESLCSAKAVVLRYRKQNLVSRMLKTVTMGRNANQICILPKCNVERWQKWYCLQLPHDRRATPCWLIINNTTCSCQFHGIRLVNPSYVFRGWPRFCTNQRSRYEIASLSKKNMASDEWIESSQNNDYLEFINVTSFSVSL